MKNKMKKCETYALACIIIHDTNYHIVWQQSSITVDEACTLMYETP